MQFTVVAPDGREAIVKFGRVARDSPDRDRYILCDIELRGDGATYSECACIFHGWAKRHPKDVFDKGIGMRIALQRAVSTMYSRSLRKLIFQQFYEECRKVGLRTKIELGKDHDPQDQPIYPPHPGFEAMSEREYLEIRDKQRQEQEKAVIPVWTPTEAVDSGTPA